MFNHFPLLGAMLAATITLSSLAGCQAAAPNGPAPVAEAKKSTPATAPVSGSQGLVPVAVAEAGTELAAALTAERESEDLVMLAEDGEANAYSVLQLGAKLEAAKGAPRVKQKMNELRKNAFRAKLKPEVKTKLEERAKAFKAAAKPRLEKMKEHAGKLKQAAKDAPWVDNGDGTETKTVTIEATRRINAKSFGGQRVVTRTRRIEDKVLLSVDANFSHTGPLGGTYTMTRSKDLQEDGSYKVVFHAEMNLPGGKQRVTDWEKTIAADGSVSGSGTMVVKKGEEVLKSVNLTLSGTEKKEIAKAEDGKASAEVSLPQDSAPTAVVTDAAGKTEAIAVETADDGTVAPAENTAI
ncbi:MAG: hypothetical protein VKP62_13265 [Candidatus Sericytochromatia bacterium]|nr:hypothetical protein [Candidatus Sericytochromatia bacterium]